MKYILSTACFLSVLIGTSYTASLFPRQITASTNLQVGGDNSASSTTSTSGSSGGLTNILSSVDIPGILRGVNSLVKIVGIFCPPLSQVLDNVIQNVTSTAFRVFGRIILQNGGLGGGGGGGGNSGGGGGSQHVNVVLPTYPPDEDDDYDDEDDATDVKTSNSTEVASTSTTTQITVSPANEDNTISKRHVRVVRQAEDQVGAESAPQPSQDLTNVEIEDPDRNKRFLPFGGGAGHGGGSGNFLFDIIRNTADSAARTVGTVYRMVAGTENLELPATPETVQEQHVAPSIASSVASSLASSVATLAATSAASSAVPVHQLVAGSGATEESDEKANAPGGVAEVDISKTADGYTEGIPGPITRLFVIANRGIANLVQDLILRLAQTSERLVNFKARLVTSLI